MIHNGQNEPPYPNHFTVVFSIRYPDLVGHLPTEVCPVSFPHLFSECLECNPAATQQTEVQNYHYPLIDYLRHKECQ